MHVRHARFIKQIYLQYMNNNFYTIQNARETRTFY